MAVAMDGVVVGVILLMSFFIDGGGAYTPGVSVFSRSNYIEYIPGTLPIILACPHDGTLEDASVPERTNTKLRDTDASIITNLVAESLYAKTGHLPHRIICHLRRNKVCLYLSLPLSLYLHLTQQRRLPSSMQIER